MTSCRSSLNKWQCVLPRGHKCLHTAVNNTYIGVVEVMWDNDYKAIPMELREAGWPADTDARALGCHVGYG